ncbi:O-antigen polymerase [Nitratiruptor sp. YY09-18]|uniref:O-antigen polymerase n=1 Tax=Nitratiruptor sp. YY09-18 TaxID=2724901 RepID=UPI001916193D|nr:O-antigen polymerase [Nitratiruptor sp. YY09-18]BCD67951.1 hypothetical protein NitYY0918_C0859 [Nitratiruptor sp. YY09-18]
MRYSNIPTFVPWQIIKYFFYNLTIFTILAIIYVKIIIPLFSYEGFYLNFSIEKVLISLLFLLMVSLPIKKKEMVSTSLINALIVFSYIPMLILFSFENLSLEFMLYVTISVYAIILFTQYFPIFVKFKIFPFRLKFFMLILVPLFLSILIYMFYKNFAYFNLDISKVYEYRAVISENTPTLIAYIYNILFKGIIPILFLFYLFHTSKTSIKIIITIILIILYIIIFGITSHKFYLFIIPFMVSIYLVSSIFKKTNLVFANIMIFLLISIFILSLFKNNLFLWITSLFIRRLLFVPADLNFAYFEFFNDHTFVYFSDSKFLPFYYIIGYPYDLNVPHLVGREIFGNPAMGANTGWIGSGYAHMGFIGMLFYAFIISIILKYLDFLSKYLDKKFLVFSFIPYIITLFLSSDLKTTLLNHGLFFYLILLSFLANYKKRRYSFYEK